ncbi:uncharacterized protein si:rp71-46j2.7 [Osmerus mordax]|uniref:uncharacterized protein si:rp71-46j2.7 n=1 Tax=Osmerus mordax TaxID=8014 RepID=UPI00350EEC62
MYRWRFSIAIVLGFLWYFSDYGRTLTQLALCFLCFPSTSSNLKTVGRESSTQTDEVTEKNVLLQAEERLCDTDGTDNTKKTEKSLQSLYPHVKKSLLQVFECAYIQLILPWYTFPEPCDSQPLHQVLWREFDCVFDQIIDKAKDFDVCAASVGCVRILTQHLRNSKQSVREPLFISRAEEVAVLRGFAETLVQNLFPESLWGLDINHCVLNETITFKVLESLVIWLSDPDNLNQLVVSQLDKVSPKNSEEDLLESDSPASQDSEGSIGVKDGTEDSQAIDSKSKKKANKLKENWSKFLDKMKTKKDKKKKIKELERSLMFRAIAAQSGLTNEDEASSKEGSIHSQQNFDSEDSDLENYLVIVQEDMMEFKLSYEMWCVGHWAVSVPLVRRDDEELCFTIHLEERDNPENLQWDVRKTRTDVIYFLNRWQDSANVPCLSVLGEEGSEKTGGEEMDEKARTSLELFLQGMISDDVIGRSQPVFQFLCPLDKLLNEEEHNGGVWGLLSGLAYFLTPGKEEDEQNNPRVEAKQDDLPPESETRHSSPEPEKDVSGDETDASLPTIIISECIVPSEFSDGKRKEESEPTVKSCSMTNIATSSQNKMDNPENLVGKKYFCKGLSRSEETLVFSEAAHREYKIDPDCKTNSSNNGGSLWDVPDHTLWRSFCAKSNKTKEKMSPSICGGIARIKGRVQETVAKGDASPSLKKDQTSWEQLEATKAIFDLLKEISGNSILINIFDAILKPVMPILKKKVNSFLKKMNPTEAHMASYIDNLCEKWSQTSLAPPKPSRAPRSSEDKNETRDRAHHLISARYSNYLILKKSDMETVFKLFQDCEENKKLVYMLLSFLLRGLLPGEDALNVSAMALRKVNVNHLH